MVEARATTRSGLTPDEAVAALNEHLFSVYERRLDALGVLVGLTPKNRTEIVGWILRLAALHPQLEHLNRMERRRRRISKRGAAQIRMLRRKHEKARTAVADFQRYAVSIQDDLLQMLAVANAVAHMMIIAALDTGMRRGELLKLRFGDVDFDQQVIHVRPENAKNKRGRIVPIGTTRLRTLLEWLRIAADGQPKAAGTFVFTRGDDEAVKSFRTAWEHARTAAGLCDVRFHDLRSEYASRLVEKGVPLSQVRDLLGHSTIAVTERYDRQVLASLKNAAGKLDDGQPFKNLSSSDGSTPTVESVSPTH